MYDRISIVADKELMAGHRPMEIVDGGKWSRIFSPKARTPRSSFHNLTSNFEL